MSFGERGLSPAQKLGCGLYALIAGYFSAGFAISGAMGDCPIGNDCPTEFDRALMVYGMPIGFFIGGLLLTRFFMRDKD